MSEFTVRIELHRATGENYARLHAAMEQAAYRRFLKGGDGNTYALPTAEYDASADDWTAEQVRDHAQRIAHAIDPGAYVLVTKSEDRAWYLPVIGRAT